MNTDFVKEELIIINQIFSLHRVYKEKTDEYFLLKKFSKPEFVSKNMEWEMKCYRDLEHPNILKEFKQGKDHLLIPYKKDRDLFNSRFYEPCVDENWARNIFVQLLNSVKYIHSKNIIHKNISTNNILLGETDVPLLISFSMTGEECLTKPPEIYLYNTYNEKCDIFNLGVVLFELVTGFIPFQTATYSDLWYKKIIKQDYSLYWKIFDRDEKYSREFKDLIQKMFHHKPRERIDITGIENHDWFLGNNLPTN